MKRRLVIWRGLLSAPQVLFLTSRHKGWTRRTAAASGATSAACAMSRGITVLLTTHYMEEAEALADRAGIIDHGQLVVEGQPGELVRQMGLMS